VYKIKTIMFKIYSWIALWNVFFAKEMMIYCNNCYNSPLFGTKTPYVMIENLDLNVTYPDTCEPIQINMLHRHGNRYPSTKDVRKMDDMIDKVNAEINSNFEGINKLDLSLPLKKLFSEETDKLLSNVGEKELYELAKRIKARFPGVFELPYTPLNYNIQSSCKLRCTHSANALAAGFFHNTGVLGECDYQPVAIESLPCNNDPILRFFEMCQKYVYEVTKNKSALKEVYEFGKGPELKSVVEKIKFKLGLPNLDLEPVHVQSMFILCAYNIGMFKGSLHKDLCSLFDEEDRKILEYWYDLKHFYRRSLAYGITYKSSCYLLKNMYDTLLEAKENPSKAFKGIFRSAHAETIIPFYTLLGLFGNEYLTHKNYQEMRDRKFRSACFSPFSGNTYFVLYKCANNKFKIQLYVNELLKKMPCCDSEIDCDFDVFLQCYKKVIEQCNLDKLCKIDKKIEL